MVEAAAWYERQQADLGKRFLAAADAEDGSVAVAESVTASVTDTDSQRTFPSIRLPAPFPWSQGRQQDLRLRL